MPDREERDNPSVYSADGSAMTPGGDFYWLTKTFAWGGGSGGESLADSHGHNIVAIDFNLGQDLRLSQSPGGTYPSQYLGCTSCHDPHGKAGGGTKSGALPVSVSGSYGELPAGSTRQGNYRLLGDSHYGGGNAVAAQGFQFSYDAPVARQNIVTRFGESDGSHVDYGEGMSEWCGNCHGDMLGDHSIIAGDFVHPIGSTGTLTTDMVSMYNSYINTGDLVANSPGTGDIATAYLQFVPFERETSDQQQLDPTSTEGPNTNSKIMCLTCHRAHASAFRSIGRWDLDAVLLANSIPGPETSAYPEMMYNTATTAGIFRMNSVRNRDRFVKSAMVSAWHPLLSPLNPCLSPPLCNLNLIRSCRIPLYRSKNLEYLKIMSKIVHFLSLLLFTIIGCGCTSPQTRTVYTEPLVDQGELYLYLQPLPQEMQSLSFTISDISVISEEGNAILPILSEKMTISGKGSTGMQKRLVAAVLPPGRYWGVSLTIEQASISTEKGEVDLLPPAEPIRLEHKFFVLRGTSLALFMDLSSEFLVTDGYRFTPRLVLGTTSMPPSNYLGFISNSPENIVTVFNKRSMEVIKVIHTGTGPKGMALDQQNGIVYVAAAGDGIIEMISIATLEIMGRIRLSFGDEPSELALTPDGRTLLSANYGSGTVSIINTRSMSEERRLVLDPDPAWIVMGLDGRTAYVLHTMSNTISVVDVAGRRQLTSVSLDESPVRGALSRDGNSLYIISDIRHPSWSSTPDPLPFRKGFLLAVMAPQLPRM